jgi:hypothetical protein
LALSVAEPIASDELLSSCAAVTLKYMGLRRMIRG